MADDNGRGGSGENSKAVGKHFKLRRKQKSKLHEEGLDLHQNRETSYTGLV